MITGAELHTLRLTLGWSQRELATRAGVTRNYVSMIESGQRPGSAAFWRVINRILEDDPVRRGEFLRLSGAAVAGAVAGVGASAPSPEARAGRRIFAAISAGDSRPFATSQTTHGIDLAIRSYVSASPSSQRLLARWMHRPGSPVLQVNAAGVLAKLDRPELTDDVITALRSDESVRRLYLTAVASRVLPISWGQAGLLAGADHRRIALPDRHRAALVDELDNERDGAARWCALSLLGGHAPRERLLHRLQAESSRETLRDLGFALAG